MELKNILDAYGIMVGKEDITAFGSGLINHTWKLHWHGKDYILQRVNDNVFKTPKGIENNIFLIGKYLADANPQYSFVRPLQTPNGQEMVYEEGNGYFRIFPFVTDSHAKDVVETPDQAYEAARQFGRFTRLLQGIDIDIINTTIPQFHDLSLRYHQFEESLETGDKKRIAEAQELINELLAQKNIVTHYEDLVEKGILQKRVTHHDTKISNVLFDSNDKGICVIDLDTVMPGYFISDLGDMMRTYLCPVSEEEKDFKKLEVRKPFYEAIVKGYYEEMQDVLTPQEKENIAFSGSFIIYMQALRFLTDYLNNDVYYGSRYPGHNFVRAGNQAVLLKRYREMVG